MNAVHALHDGGIAAKTTSQPSLQDCVRQTVRRYIRDLGDHPPEDLHALVLQEVERSLLDEVMEHCGNNQCRAAAALGIDRSTLRKKLRQYELT